MRETKGYALTRQKRHRQRQIPKRRTCDSQNESDTGGQILVTIDASQRAILTKCT